VTGIAEWIKNVAGIIVLRRQAAKSPVLTAALLRSSTVFDNLPLKKQCSAETRTKLSRGLLEKVYGIIGAPDPILKCRQELAGIVIELSQWQVLVLPPEPEADPTRMRGTQGVTGRLKQHLLEISKKDKKLKELMHGWTENPTYDDVWEAVLTQYWVCYWFAETINACRIALGDCNAATGRDWYQPWYHSMCVWAEHAYRREAGLPLAIEGKNESITALAYSTFLDSVLAGDRYPDLFWKEHYKEMIERGELQPPF
jgi:hypothetical protein